MSILKLPLELRELICSFIDDQKDLKSLAFTSKKFTASAERFLYRTVHIKSIRQAGYFALFVKRKGRSKYVRDLTLDTYDTNYSVYRWALKRIPEFTLARDAGLRGLEFNTEVFVLFPKLENLRIYAQSWSPELSTAIMSKLSDPLSLPNLRSCLLAFRPYDDQSTGPYWSLWPWRSIFCKPTIETLDLVRAEGYSDTSFSDLQPSTGDTRTNLKTLRLFCCKVSHNWLSAALRFPIALRELEVVVTTKRAARSAEHMFLQRCSCMAPLTDTLEALTYINLRTRPAVPMIHHFAMFTKLKELTTSATELLGDSSRQNIGTVLQDLHHSIPRTLQILHLSIHRTDLFGDSEGEHEGAFKVLQHLLSPEHKHQVPVLTEIILHIYAKYPTIPLALTRQGSAAGVKIRLASEDEIMSMRERHQLRLLMY